MGSQANHLTLLSPQLPHLKTVNIKYLFFFFFSPRGFIFNFYSIFFSKNLVWTPVNFHNCSMQAYEPEGLCFLFSAVLLISCMTPDRSLNLCGLLLPHSYGGIILTYLREGCEAKLVFRKDCWSTRCKLLLCWVLHRWETNLETENQFNIWSPSS